LGSNQQKKFFMSAVNEQQQKINNSRQFLGVDAVTDLTTLKQRYALLSDKFEAQRCSGDEEAKQKGHTNMQMLDQAFAAVADDIRSREFSSQPEQSEQTMTVEYASMRVGFQILEGGSKFFVLETRRISGFGSTRTNNILSTSWPTGKLSLYNDHLELTCLLGSHSVQFHDITAIDKAWYSPFWLRVNQKSKQAETVHIFGWALGKKFKDVVQKNRLPLKLDF
jgi:hypothetical protein